MDINQVIKEIEAETKEKLMKNLLGKQFEGSEFPKELMDITVQAIVDSVLINFAPQSFNLKPIRQSHIFLITATDESDNTIVDVMYITKYQNNNPLDFEIEDINVAVKEYVLKKTAEQIEAGNNQVENKEE
ncbi:hypothetical protein [Bacillus sp. NPDC094106]|uniref:hypothetical protein n=1 Tax=Bacillus sp. NPDC094106 TaxID=3363949 RepID=UPI0038121EDD